MAFIGYMHLEHKRALSHIKNFLASDPVYLSFEDFLKDCGIKLLH